MESFARKRRELLPLLEENLSGEWAPEYLEYNEELNNTYVTVTPAMTSKTSPIVTVPKDSQDIVLEYYTDSEEPKFTVETLPLNPPPLNPIGGALPPPNMIQGRDLMDLVNEFWTDDDDETDQTSKRSVGSTASSATTPRASSTSTSTSTTSTTTSTTTSGKQVTYPVVETSKPMVTIVIPDVRRIEPPKYAELPGQPRKSRTKSRARRGWYGFLTKLRIIYFAPFLINL